ncbi:MAG: dihydroxyacetone kinase subunit L [Clostridium sp.]|nr:dihydroxyacetone kinase subunit L [Clostridium sp.]
MILNVDQFKAMLIYSCSMIEEKLGILSDLDSKFGDGNHGVTMGKICRSMREIINSWQGDIHGLLLSLAEKITSINGGATIPLWGTFLEGLSEGVEEEKEIDEETLKDMLLAALINIQLVTKAQVGDKTMMDVLIPVVNQSRNDEGNVYDMLTNISKVAKERAEATKELKGTFGIGKCYGEKSVGHMDPGALSLALFFEGWAQIVN